MTMEVKRIFILMAMEAKLIIVVMAMKIQEIFIVMPTMITTQQWRLLLSYLVYFITRVLDLPSALASPCIFCWVSPS